MRQTFKTDLKFLLVGRLKLLRNGLDVLSPLHIVCYCILFLWSETAYTSADSTDNWQVTVSDSMLNNDNLFLLPKNASSSGIILPQGARLSDTINKSMLSGVYNYQISDQKIILNVEVDKNQYFNNPGLDYIATNDSVTWKWRAARYLSGGITQGFRIYQSSFNNTTYYAKDMINENTTTANAQLSLDPRWRIISGINWLDTFHNVVERSFLDRQSVGANLGVEYRTAADNTVTLQYQYSEYYFPNLQLVQLTLVDNRALQQNFSLQLNWKVLDKTRMIASLGYTEKNYNNYSARNFAGLTGSLSVNWEPTAKLNLSLNASQQLISAADETANYMVSELISAGAGWKLTDKISISGNLSHNQRVYSGDPGLVISGQPVRQDEILIEQIGLKYSPIRNANFNLNYQNAQRTSNAPGADYLYTLLSANASFRF